MHFKDYSDVSEALDFAVCNEPSGLEALRAKHVRGPGVTAGEEACFHIAQHLHDLMNENVLRHDELATAQEAVASDDWRLLAIMMRTLDLIRRYEAGDASAVAKIRDLFSQEGHLANCVLPEVGRLSTFEDLMEWVRSA